MRGEITASSSGEIDVAWCLTELARAETALGRPAEAVTLAEEALDLLGDAPRRATAGALTVLGEASVRLGRRDRAVEVLTRAATCLEQMESSREAAQAWFDLAEVLAEAGPTGSPGWPPTGARSPAWGSSRTIPAAAASIMLRVVRGGGVIRVRCGAAM